MKKLAIVLCALLVLIVGGIGCCAEEETATPAPTPNDGTKMPEDVIPLTVPGFSFVEKSDRILIQALGEQYYAYSFFVPKTGSKFSNKVHSLEVRAHLFEAEASAKAAASGILTVGADFFAEIQVNDATAILTYREDYGEAAAIQQQGRLAIISLSMPPFEAIAFDRQTLEDAAIEGLKAVRLTAMPTIPPTPTSAPSTPTPTPTAVSISIGPCGKRIPLKPEVYIAGEMMHIAGLQ